MLLNILLLLSNFLFINCKSNVLIEDFCDPDPCLNDGYCFSSDTSFKCFCPEGFQGVRCEEKAPFSSTCKRQVCLHGGICQKDFLDEEKCVCQQRFFGDYCHMIKPDPCIKNGCKNGRCLPDYEFENYQCVCENGFYGEFCENQIDFEDFVDPCQNGEIVLLNSDEFKCDCAPGFSGEYCEVGFCIERVSSVLILD